LVAELGAIADLVQRGNGAERRLVVDTHDDLGAAMSHTVAATGEV
jgi:hypothetical protein